MLTQSHSYLQLEKEESGEREGNLAASCLASQTMACGQEGTEFCQYTNITTIALFALYLEWTTEWPKINLCAFSILNFPRITTVEPILTCLGQVNCWDIDFCLISHYYLSGKY